MTVKALIYVDPEKNTVSEVYLVGKNVTPVEFQVVAELPLNAPNTSSVDLMDRFFGDGRGPRI